MDHPFILGFCQTFVFDTVFPICFSVFRKNTFLNYCHILIILCISDSKMGDPRLLLFQNRTLISKLEPYPKGISVNGIFHGISRPSDEEWRRVTKCDEVWRSVTKFGRSLDEVWRQKTKFGQIIVSCWQFEICESTMWVLGWYDHWWNECRVCYCTQRSRCPTI